MSLPRDIDAVVFDCDGLLVDTETCWTRAETALFAAHGHGFGVDQKQLLIGGTLEAAGAAMAAYFGTPGDGAALAQRLHELVAIELAAGADALAGARDRRRICTWRRAPASARTRPGVWRSRTPVPGWPPPGPPACS